MIGPAGFGQHPGKEKIKPRTGSEISGLLRRITCVGKPTLDEYVELYAACIRAGMSSSPGRTRAGQESALQFLRESLGVSKSTITRLERMRKLIASPAPRIVETVTGYRAYHLSESGKNGEPTLCKADVMVMSTQLHLRCWNQTGHLREKYCKECTRIAERNGVALPKADASTLVF